MKRLMVVLLILFTGYLLFCQRDVMELKDVVNIDRLKADGDDWQVVHQQIDPHTGRIQLYTDKWLMFFLHWRPLEADSAAVTVDYARHLMLNFWGDEMPFEIDGEGGEVTVAGHRACFIDGTLWEGKIRTRFIVWNCEHSQRQFIADCNINQGRGTARKWLELQFDMVGSISCHGQPPLVVRNARLNDRFISREMNVGFGKPAHWKTSLYNSRDWYPRGPTARKGSFWTLTSTANKIFQIDWTDGTTETAQQWKNRLRRISGSAFNAYKNLKTTLRLDRISEVSTTDDRFRAEVMLSLLTRYQGKDIEQPYKGVVLSWIHGGRRITVLVAIVSMKSVWDLPFDLEPSDESCEMFLQREVLPAVTWR